MMNVIFVNHGLFNSNSGGHVALFANSLAALGANVTVLGNNDPASVRDFGPPAFDAIQVSDAQDPTPAVVIERAGRPHALVHAWTPRGRVQQIVESITRETGCPYVVHLEDNETLLLASALGMSPERLAIIDDDELDRIVPPTLAQPRRAREFLRRALGVTTIVPRLSELCPEGVPTHLLEPGVDTATFACDLAQEDIARLRAELYIDPGAKIIVYNGNVHSANHRDVFSLYTAVLILRRRGLDVVLIRTGRDYHSSMDDSYQHLKGEWTIDLGMVERGRMIETLKMADIYVQPGPAEGFNAYRLPSKVPEFLSLGRPVLLPATNIGLRLRDGVDAFLLQRGDGTEIADRVEEILRLEDQGRGVGGSGRRFAIENLNWQANAAALLSFYDRLLRARAASRGQHAVGD